MPYTEVRMAHSREVEQTMNLAISKKRELMTRAVGVVADANPAPTRINNAATIDGMDQREGIVLSLIFADAYVA